VLLLWYIRRATPQLGLAFALQTDVGVVVLLQELPDESALHQLLSQDVDNALWTLTEKERGVLRMRYGLDDGEEKTLEDIGLCFNVRSIAMLLDVKHMCVCFLRMYY
jgi:hypothetical protein